MGERPLICDTSSVAEESLIFRKPRFGFLWKGEMAVLTGQRTSAIRPLIGLTLCLALMGCVTPRGAGFQSEVLAASEAKGEAAAEFAVYPVTKASLPALTSWPKIGERRYAWVPRRAGSAESYVAVGDMIGLTVWDTEADSLLAEAGARKSEIRNLKVGADGTISLPFVGNLRVSGQTPEAVRAAIEQRYAEAIPSAQVQIDVTQGRANTANLVSGVAAPGSYPVPDRDYTVLSLLADGGGVLPGLNNPQVRLMRGNDVYGTSVSRLFDHPTLDTTLRGGDRIIVEEDDRYFLSLGAAGSEALHPFPKDEVSALDALSIIGGVQDTRADPQGILILREYPPKAVKAGSKGPAQQRVVFTLDLTSADGLFSARSFAIMPGDLVYATESRVTSARSVLGLMGSALGIVNQASAN